MKRPRAVGLDPMALQVHMVMVMVMVIKQGLGPYSRSIGHECT